jgi:hypothetical protein
MRVNLSTVAGLVAASALLGAGCGGDGSDGEAVRVVGTEYAFEMPDQIDGGVVKMDFVNQGAEPHEFALARLDSGKTLDDVNNVLKRGQEPPSWAHDIGGVPAMTPGEEISITRELRPGTYVFLCFIPGPNGKPHYELGMEKQFTASGDSGASLPEADGVITAENDRMDVPAVEAGEQTLELRNAASKPREFNLLAFEPGKGPADARKWFQGGFEGKPPLRLLGAMQSIPPASSVFLTADFDAGTTYYVTDEENGLRQSFKVG